MGTLNQVIFFFWLCALLCHQGWAAEISPSDPLVPPGLVSGNSFHFVFATNEDGVIGSTNTIEELNNYVINVANNLNGETGSIVDQIGAQWFVIGSGVTSSTNSAIIDARDNAAVSGPVYLLDGQLVATGYADIWDGTIATGDINLHEDGVTTGLPGNVAHTGTEADGTANVNRSFGTSATDDGRIQRGVTGSSWINQGSETDRNNRAIYALSELITIRFPPRGTIFMIE